MGLAVYILVAVTTIEEARGKSQRLLGAATPSIAGASGSSIGVAGGEQRADAGQPSMAERAQLMTSELSRTGTNPARVYSEAAPPPFSERSTAVTPAANLSPQQLGLVQDFIDQGLPSHQIASAVETMLASSSSGAAAASPSTQSPNGQAASGPPKYDFKERPSVS